jgi:hypothetical protein
VTVVFNNSILHIGNQGMAFGGRSLFLGEPHLLNPLRDTAKCLYVKIIHIIAI